MESKNKVRSPKRSADMTDLSFVVSNLGYVLAAHPEGEYAGVAILRAACVWCGSKKVDQLAQCLKPIMSICCTRIAPLLNEALASQA